MWFFFLTEPFDLTNTARSVYDEAVFERVKKVFVDSYKLLNEKRDLSSILLWGIVVGLGKIPEKKCNENDCFNLVGL